MASFLASYHVTVAMISTHVQMIVLIIRPVAFIAIFPEPKYQ